MWLIKNTQLLIIAVLFTSAAPLFAGGPTSSKKLMSTSYFFKQIEKKISTVMCRKNGYIDKCYKISLDQCKSTVNSNKYSCLMPKRYTNVRRLNSKRKKNVTRKIAKCLQKNILQKNPHFQKKVRSKACEINI